ncbi:hypothetical protein LTS18_004875 [Coniosporium uncinatum]|uniref:Uncharacterized protein n=1 Tax=Coniosporium uncinatum TaxID=93489 RepID=A0ACC3DD31_9PEZI|nr:hypothetical protein LTS18_004875 [Coniosporium uncinatum]
MVMLPDPSVTESPVKRLFNTDLLLVRQTMTTVSTRGSVTLQSPTQIQDGGFGNITYLSPSGSVDHVDISQSHSALDSYEPLLENLALDFEGTIDGLVPAGNVGEVPYDLTDFDGMATASPSPGAVDVHERLCTSPGSNADADDSMQSQSVAMTVSSVAKHNLQALSNRKKTETNERPNKKSRRSGMKDVSEGSCESLDSYLEKERLRCEEQDTSGPLETFFGPEIQQGLSELGAGMYSNALQTICVAIASSESLVTLQHLLRYYRAGESPKTLAPAIPQSTKDRVSVIGAIDKEVAYMCILRRCHIFRLYEENRPGFSHGFVSSTQQTIATQGRRGPGNPKNIADSNITKVIMGRTFPDLEIQSKEYEQSYRRINSLRRLGRRLCMLKERFGHGIFGLMQYDWGIESPLNITDKM